MILPSRQIALSLSLLLLVACAQQPVATAPPAEPVFSAPPAADVRKPQREPVLPIEQIVQLLESGDYRNASKHLKRFLAAHPSDSAAKNLLQQTRLDPLSYLGAEHTTHVVEQGETLSSIARRYLGSAMRFVILARYNALANPKQLEVGQTLKIPLHPPVIDRPLAATASPSAAATASGWPPPAGTGATVLARLYGERIEMLLAAERYLEAVDTAAEAGERQPATGAWSGWLKPLDQRANALLWQQRAIAQMQTSDVAAHESAYAGFAKALALSPELEPAKTYREAMRSVLVLDYHEAAIVRYRNQQLDAALELWDKALALDPQFGPAQGYRLRALELKRRVQNLDAAAAQQTVTDNP